MQAEAPALAWAGVVFPQEGPDLRPKTELGLYAVRVLVFLIFAEIV